MPDEAVAPDTTESATPTGKAVPVSKSEVEALFRARIATSKSNKREFRGKWKANVDARLGVGVHVYTEGLGLDDELKSEINPDWSLTKAKTANLFSQVPQVQLTHENKTYAAAIPPFAKALNYEIGEKRANIGVAMEEVLNDVVNAAGVGAVYVGYAARFEPKMVPAVDTSHLDPNAVAQMRQVPLPGKSAPDTAQRLLGLGFLPMTMAQQVVSDMFFGKRISPNDLLWPAEFNGSCFDDGDWIGHTDAVSWAEAKNEFKLRDEDKAKAIGGSDNSEDSLRADPEKAALAEAKKVKYDQLFYWRYRVDPEEKNFKAIWRIVFVHGIDTPVIHEPWKGQRLDPQTKKYVGCCRFPIRVLTLTYITDNPIPPSDTEAGRPQVNDLRRSRNQMFMNRERSRPIRWFDVNRIDPAIQDLLMKGTWQGMIPTNGDGSRTVGEIARASYPSEDFSFDQATKNDLMEIWQIGPRQLGAAGPASETASSANITQENFATRIGQERGRVASFFLSICDVFAGLIALYSDFPTLSDEERQGLYKAWDTKRILHDLVLKIRPDSTIVLDSQARIARLMQFLNMTVKSGFVNPKPIIIEIAELSGVDPTEVVVDPQPPSEDPNVSYRFTGKDDLMNPFVVAMLIKKGQAPSVEQIKEAQKLLLSAQQLPPPEPPPGQPEMPPPGGAGPEPPQPGEVLPDAHPQWSGASKIGQRTRDVAGSENE